MHGPRHASRARGPIRLSICTERGMSGRMCARALSGDARMHGCASWAFGFYGTVPREAHARLRHARVKTKTAHTPKGVCGWLIRPSSVRH
jgi:hypothetical protein